MKKSNLKYYIGIIIMLLIEVAHVVFFDNNDKYDVYLFYPHERYLTNIMFDISVLFKFSILTYWLITLNRKIFKPFFLMSLCTWLSYFTFYNQSTSLLLVPLYLIFVLWYNRNIFK